MPRDGALCLALAIRRRAALALSSLVSYLLPDDEFRRLGVRGDLLARPRGAYRLLCRGIAVLQEHDHRRPVLDLSAAISCLGCGSRPREKAAQPGPPLNSEMVGAGPLGAQPRRPAGSRDSPLAAS